MVSKVILMLPLHNLHRTIESVVLKLLEWGQKSAVQVSNQPVLPHAIIALNCCDNNLPLEHWTVENATDWLLGDLDDLAS